MYWVVLAVGAQRCGELVRARRNAQHLLAAGGVETGAGHYPLLVAVHGGWLLAVVALWARWVEVEAGDSAA